MAEQVEVARAAPLGNDRDPERLARELLAVVLELDGVVAERSSSIFW